MAEGYLRFFTHNKAEVSSACLIPSDSHPLTLEVMMEDNIDVSELLTKNIADVSHDSFDYLITVGHHTDGNIAVPISAVAHIHFDIPDPEEQVRVMDAKQAFTDTRERIKREMLRFIGMHDDLHRYEEAPSERA